MTNVFRRIFVHGAPHKATLCAALLTARLRLLRPRAQDTAAPETALRPPARSTLPLRRRNRPVQHQRTHGTNYLNQTVDLVPSNTFGAIVNLRYTVKPYVGLRAQLRIRPLHRKLHHRQHLHQPHRSHRPQSSPFSPTPTSTPSATSSTPRISTTASPHGSPPEPAPPPSAPPRAAASASWSRDAPPTTTPSARTPSPSPNTSAFRATFRQNFYLAPDYETNYIRDPQTLYRL